MSAATANEAVVTETAVTRGAGGVNALRASDLHTVLSDALNFVSHPDLKLPMLEVIHLEAGLGQLIAVATDRFTLGVSRCDYHGEPFTLALSASDAKYVAGVTKTRKGEAPTREVSIEIPESTAYERRVAVFHFSSGEQATAVHLDEQIAIDWRKRIPATDKGMGAVIGVAYNSVWLAKFAKVRPQERRRVTLFAAMSDSRLQPTVVQVGENFVGVIMPSQPDSDSEECYRRPAWLDGAPANESETPR